MTPRARCCLKHAQAALGNPPDCRARAGRLLSIQRRTFASRNVSAYAQLGERYPVQKFALSAPCFESGSWLHNVQSASETASAAEAGDKLSAGITKTLIQITSGMFAGPGDGQEPGQGDVWRRVGLQGQAVWHSRRCQVLSRLHRAGVAPHTTERACNTVIVDDAGSIWAHATQADNVTERCH